METHQHLFADKVYSPAARAILLHGVESARAKNNTSSESENVFLPILRQMFYTPIEEAILEEAGIYAHCINAGLAPDEINTESPKPSSRKKPAAAARRTCG